MQDLKIWLPAPFLRKLLEDGLHQKKTDSESRKPKIQLKQERGWHETAVKVCIRQGTARPEQPEALAESPLEDKIDNTLLDLNILQQKMDSYNW